MKKSKVTLNDLSKETGMSVATISLILSGKKIERFSVETIKKVTLAAEKIGYEIKNNQKMQKTILTVCPSVFNPYFSTILQGIDIETNRLGITNIVYNTYWNLEREKNVLSIINNQKILGVIFAMMPQQVEIAKKINKKVPLLVIGDRQETLDIDTIDVNNYKAGYIVGEHLYSLGHRKIAYISTSLNDYHSARTERLRGLNDSCKKVNIEIPVIFSKDISSDYELNNIDVEYETGYELCEKCIKSKPEITAIVGINDMVSYGIIDAILDNGFLIPNDYSVCGFDNIFPSKFSQVSLSTIENSILQRGKRAVMLIAKKILENDKTDTIIRIEYGCSFIERNSTGKTT